jgi:hypothetical protein
METTHPVREQSLSTTGGEDIQTQRQFMRGPDSVESHPPKGQERNVNQPSCNQQKTRQDMVVQRMSIWDWGLQPQRLSMASEDPKQQPHTRTEPSQQPPGIRWDVSECAGVIHKTRGGSVMQSFILLRVWDNIAAIGWLHHSTAHLDPRGATQRGHLLVTRKLAQLLIHVSGGSHACHGVN